MLGTDVVRIAEASWLRGFRIRTGRRSVKRASSSGSTMALLMISR